MFVLDRYRRAREGVTDMLVVYKDLIEKAKQGPVTPGDVAKSVLANALDPFGMYRAAGRAVMDFLNSTEVTNDDATNVRNILDAGKAAGLDELEIEFEKDRFAGLRAHVPLGKPGMDVKVDMGGGANGKVRIKAKFK